jgi:chlorite dismutase
LAHTSDVNAQLAYRMQLLTKLQSIQGTTLANFQQMANAVLSAEAAKNVFTMAYPMPKRPGKASLLDELSQHDTQEYGSLYEEMTSAQEQWIAACERANSLRSDAGIMLETMNEQNGALANTAWYVYNAVTDCEDHRDGPESMFASALWGDRAQVKVRAFQSAMATITK